MPISYVNTGEKKEEKAPRSGREAPHIARMQLLPSPPESLRAALLDWYDAHARDLPWRPRPGAAADAYAVLLSEIMLQQTTVATVRPRFLAFKARFADLAALAAAPLDDVLHAWQGLGYYRRARALHALAQEVVTVHGGALPRTATGLAALPGIGPYTAAAVAAIAFGETEVPVDGNVARVLARLCRIEAPLPDLRARAAALAGGDRPGDLAQAAIELGALVCTPRTPACEACPWRNPCLARAAGDPAAWPRKVARAAKPRRYGAAFVVTRADGAVLLRRRPEAGLLGGMVEPPTTAWRGQPFLSEAEILAEAPMSAGLAPLPGEVRHGFTHFDLRLGVWRGTDGGGATEGFYHPPGRLGDLALSTLTRKLLRHAGLDA